MYSKKIVITGGTGFLGLYLTKYFTKKGYHIYIISRSERPHSYRFFLDFFRLEGDRSFQPTEYFASIPSFRGTAQPSRIKHPASRAMLRVSSMPLCERVAYTVIGTASVKNALTMLSHVSAAQLQHIQL